MKTTGTQKTKTALCALMAGLLLATVAAGCSAAGSQPNPAPAPAVDQPAQSTATAALPAAPATESTASAGKADGPATKEPTAVSAAPEREATPATVEIAEVTDEQLAQYPAYDEVDVATDEYGFKVLLTTDQPVQAIRLFRLAWDDSAQDMAEAADGTLYRQIELTADKPLVIKLSIPGTMPTVGVDYTDTDGVVKTYYIIMSGEDGSMQLMEAPSAG